MNLLGRIVSIFYKRSAAGMPASGPPRRAAGLFHIRVTVRRRTTILLGLVPPLMTLLLWWFITRGAVVEERIVSPVILPSPGEVLRSIPPLLQRSLGGSVLKSLERVALGFGCAAAIALPLGVAMAAFTRVRALFGPLTMMGSYLPIAAIVPLTLSWFGTGELQKVMFLAIASFLFLLPLTVKAVDDVDPVYVNTAYTLGATPWQVVRKVLVAIALPDIFNGLRLTFAVGWTYIILAEVIDAERGLGALIISSQRRGPREHIYLVLLLIMGIAFVIDEIFKRSSGWLFPHRAPQR